MLAGADRNPLHTLQKKPDCRKNARVLDSFPAALASNGAARGTDDSPLLRPSNTPAMFYGNIRQRRSRPRRIRQKSAAAAAFHEIFAQYVVTVLLKAKRRTLNWRSFQAFKNGNWFERNRAGLLSDSVQRL